jgi:enoyl-CoA hydratase/carnithine racemase
MPFVRSVRDGHVALVYLARPKANALVMQMVDELAAAIEHAAADDAVRAIVLASDVPRMFSGGFDVSEVFAYERAQMSAFFSRFVGLFERLRTLPKPVVAALSGHAFAGGAILALSADFRVMAESANISVNEVDLGVMLPPRIIRAMAASAGVELMRSMLLGAEVVAAARAASGGLVSQVARAEDVIALSVARAKHLGDKPNAAFAAHKRALDPISESEPLDTETQKTIDAWFAPESVALRRSLAEKLAKRG